MWIKKSEEEIRDCLDAANARPRGFLRPVVIALIVAIVALGYGPNDFIMKPK